jgi:probable rRNA maturation factor
MSARLQCDAIVLPFKTVEALWQAVISRRNFPDDAVTIRCVSEEESARLNELYRNNPGSTNVLTFSYDNEHDIALCSSVVQREAEENGHEHKSYFAWVVVHAMLHATGMDHEVSDEEAAKMAQLEQEILTTVLH